MLNRFSALIIYESQWLFADAHHVRAWAFWVVTTQGFSCKIGTWGYDRDKRSITIQNKVDAFNEELSERMRYAQIEQNDACTVITSRDTDKIFHYVDPPYIDSNQGHYGGYTAEHYRVLLDTLSKMKGKFMLSSYPSEVLSEYVERLAGIAK